MLDVNPVTGSVKVNGEERIIIQEKLSDKRSGLRVDAIADLVADQTKAHCALDVVDALEDQITLDEVGGLLFVTRERVRQIQDRAIKKIQFEDMYEGLNLRGLLYDDE